MLSYDEEGEEDWDIWWIDCQILPCLLQKMKWYQRANKLPNVQVFAKKNLLAKNLNLMQKALPDEYDFFPQTWILPYDAKKFKDQFNEKRAKTYIVKPEYSCQGQGIFLTRGYEWIHQSEEHMVAQRYIYKPYLIDGLKFDLRLYVVVTGVSPLRAFIYKEGLARFATEPYKSPNFDNLNNLTMHLTNYAINKEKEGFQQNEDVANADVGHKRSLDAIFRHIDAHYSGATALDVLMGTNKDVEAPSVKIWNEIKQMCVKTLLAGIHSIDHMYRTSKAQDVENSLCFQIFGFDVIIDSDLKPWLLEVNHSPSLMTDSPLDYSVKKNMVRDTIHLLGLS